MGGILQKTLSACGVFGGATSKKSSKLHRSLVAKRREGSIAAEPFSPSADTTEAPGTIIVLASEECLEELARQQGILQGREAWTTFFDWIDTHNPRFSFEVADNFLRGTHADEKAIANANVMRAKVSERLSLLTSGETLIALPTTPFAAPLRGQKRSAMWALRKPVMALTCIAGMAGTPQISLPVAEVEGLPIGLSLIGARGSDELLAGFALALDERARSNVAS